MLLKILFYGCVLLMSLLGAGGLKAAVPEGFLDATAAPYLADNTGTTDATAALQAAIIDARDSNLVLWLPGGTYLLSDRLEVDQPDNNPSFPVVIMGSTVNPANRATLVLAANAAGFNDPLARRAVLHYFNIGTADGESGNTDLYNQAVIGLDFKIRSGNDGAVALRMQGAEGCTIQDVHIDLTEGGHTGIWGVPGSGGSTHQVSVTGGVIGIDTRRADTLGGGGSQPTVTLTGSSFVNQSDVAIWSSTRGAMVIVGAHLERNTPGALIRLQRHWAQEPFEGTLQMVDSRVVYASHHAGNTVIEMAAAGGRSFYLENVFVQHGERVWTEEASANPAGWMHFARLGAEVRPDLQSWGQPVEQVWINGVVMEGILLESEAGAAPPVDLQSRHQWAAGFPTWESPGAVNALELGAAGDGVTDDHAALQAAIDAHDIVFLPKGHYRVSNTLTLRPQSKLIGAHHSFTVIEALSTLAERFAGTTEALGDRPIVSTADVADADTAIAFLHLKRHYPLAQHDPTPVGNYALEWRSGGSSVLRGVKLESRTGSNIRPDFVASFFYNISGDIDPNYLQDDFGEGQWAWPGSEPTVQVRGNGGGRWFGFWVHGRQALRANVPFLRVEGTRQPLRIYHLHLQQQDSLNHAEFLDVENVDVFGTKAELKGTMLYFEDSRHVRVFGSGGLASPDPARPNPYLFRFVNCDEFQVSGLAEMVNPGASLWFGGEYDRWIHANVLGWQPIQDLHTDRTEVIVTSTHRPLLYRRFQESTPPTAIFQQNFNASGVVADYIGNADHLFDYIGTVGNAQDRAILSVVNGRIRNTIAYTDDGTTDQLSAARLTRLTDLPFEQNFGVVSARVILAPDAWDTGDVNYYAFNIGQNYRNGIYNPGTGGGRPHFAALTLQGRGTAHTFRTTGTGGNSSNFTVTPENGQYVMDLVLAVNAGDTAQSFPSPTGSHTVQPGRVSVWINGALHLDNTATGVTASEAIRNISFSTGSGTAQGFETGSAWNGYYELDDILVQTLSNFTSPSNMAPVVAITAPADNSTVSQGSTVTFTGTATDAEDGNLAASAAWTSSLDGLLGSGGSLSTTALSAGTHTITASVTDSGGLSDSAQITLTVEAAPPTSHTVEFSAGTGGTLTGSISQTVTPGDSTTAVTAVPDSGHTFVNWTWTGGNTSTDNPLTIANVTQNLTVTANFQSTGGATETVSIVAEADTYVRGDDTNADINFGTANPIRIRDFELTYGLFRFDLSSIPGTIVSATIQLTASSATTSTTLNFHAVDDNAWSETAVTYNTRPAMGSVLSSYSGAIVTDQVLQGDVTAHVAANLAAGKVSIGTSATSLTRIKPREDSVASKHPVLVVTYSMAGVNSPPSVAIAAPANNASVSRGSTVTFTGTATDAEDGNLAASATWTSSLDGLLGSGASLSTSTLSSGTHTITYAATDSDNATSSQQITLRVIGSTVRKVLFIGNSYTHSGGDGTDAFGNQGVAKRFREIALAMGEEEPFVRMYAPGGSTLIGKSLEQPLLDLIAHPDIDWDVVVLQEFSTWPSDLSASNTQKFFDGVQALDTLVKASNPNAGTVLFMTWGRGDGHSLYTDNAEVLNDRLHMQAQIRRNYQLAADLVGADLVACGNAWDRAFLLDPVLGAGLYSADLSHPGSSGTWLNALMFFNHIYGVRAQSLPVPSGGSVTPEQNTALMEIAWDTQRTHEMLFIGDQFLQQGGGLATRLSNLLTAAGYATPLVQTVAGTDQTLQAHWTDPATPALTAINDVNRNWDRVVLQEYATSPTDLDATARADFLTYGQNFATAVATRNPLTATLLLQNWARSEYDTAFWSHPAHAPLVNRPTMQTQLETYTAQLAALVDAEVIPAGKAWEYAHILDGDIPLYSPDFHTPSATGTYYNALVAYAKITGSDPRGLPIPAEVDPLQGALLQTAARAHVIGGINANNAPSISFTNLQSRTVRLPAADSVLTINALIVDDGIPGLGTTVAWSQASGEGTVTFSHPTGTQTTADFSATGTYVLRLIASDTELSRDRDLIVIVGGGAAPGPVSYRAFHDMVNAAAEPTGSDHANSTFGSAHLVSYPLKNIDSGATPGSAVTVEWFNSTGISQNARRQGSVAGLDLNPPLGSPAHQRFNGFLDFRESYLWINNSNNATPPDEPFAEIEFTGLDPSRTYSFYAYGKRSGGDGQTGYTLLNVTDYTADSSAGIGVTGGVNADPYDNDVGLEMGRNDAGDVVGWKNIVPNGTSFKVRVKRSGGVYAYFPQGILIEEYSPQTYDSWAAIALASVSAPLRAAAENPDGDDLSNFAEYALGGNPVQPDATADLLSLTRGPDDAWVLTFTRNLHAGAISIAVQTSTNGVDWNDDPLPMTLLADNGSLQTLRVQKPSAQPHLFRLKLSDAEEGIHYTPALGDPYLVWISQNAITGGPAGLTDGVPNLLRYAMGGTAVSPASDFRLEPDADATGMSLSFPRIDDPRLTYEVWATDNLLDWGDTPYWSGQGSGPGVVQVPALGAQLYLHLRVRRE